MESRGDEEAEDTPSDHNGSPDGTAALQDEGVQAEEVVTLAGGVKE